MNTEVTISESQYNDLMRRAESLIDCRTVILTAMAGLDSNLFDQWVHNSMGRPSNTVDALKALLDVFGLLPVESDENTNA